MPREPRVLADDVHYHIILRCNNKERLITESVDFAQMLTLLKEVKEKLGFRLYNYELLNAHVHLMLSTHEGKHTDKILHEFCFKFAKYFNHRHHRSGHFWAHRYRSRLIKNNQYALACLRYQNRNALSLSLVPKPEDWPWGGYSFYAFNAPNALLEPHPSYLELHNDETKRRIAYQKLVNTPIPADKIPLLLEKGSGKMTKRFRALLEQTDRLRRKITI